MAQEEKNNGAIVASEHEIRKEKALRMRKDGIEPWPAHKPVSATCSQALCEFSAFADEAKEYSVAGRLVSLREHGRTIFSHLQDRSGKLQLYFRSDVLGKEQFSFLKSYVDLGDILWVRGTLFTTKTGETTLRCLEIVLLSKCLHPLPEKFHGLVDVEHRYRQRYLDLISNQESRNKFINRFKIVQFVRDFLLQADFLEVETPMLHPIPGGAAARPFVTHHNAYHMDLFLRIAPELYLKRLVIGGLERVFEINRNFRNEGVSTKHNPEFTMLEYYMAHGDYQQGMTFTEELIDYVIGKSFNTLALPFNEREINYTRPFKRMTLEESLHQIGGFSEKEISQDKIDDLLKAHEITFEIKTPSYGERLWALFEKCVEHKLIQPTFITGHPLEVSPLAKRDLDNPFAVARFELFVAGIELANGFSELNDPFDQADRFKKQAEAAQAGYKEAHRYDADYIKALEYGLPPTVGVGLGIDRLVMLLTNTPSIKDVILFPTMKPQQ